MCIINNSYRFIFIHVPKTAGTSVTSALGTLTSYCDLEVGGSGFGEKIQPAYKERFGLTKHSTAAEVRAIVGAVTWSRYFTFAFVRNPFDRALSTFHFLRTWEGDSNEFHERMKSFENFDDYVLSDIWEKTDGPDNIFRPQVSWLRMRPGSDRLLVNYVGKLEQIDEDLNTVLRTVEMPRHLIASIELKRLNASVRTQSFTSNPAVIAKIVEKYRADFETFEYSKEPPIPRDRAAGASQSDTA